MKTPSRSPYAILLTSAILASTLVVPCLAASRPVVTLLEGTPADSLAAPLARLEGGDPASGGEAALTLGALHFARGEYREAVTAYARAAARLDPAHKAEARYWAGLAWLGLGEPTRARASLEEAAREDSPRRIDALLGIAQAWDLSGRADRATDALSEVAEGELGETGPALLERLAALSERLKHPDQARRARERLLAIYPRSIEAAAARLELAQAEAGSAAGHVAVVIGSFLDRARAQSLAGEAQRAGFPGAQVVTRGEGLAAVHTVRLGTYSRHLDARRAGDQAAKALGVTYRIVRSP